MKGENIGLVAWAVNIIASMVKAKNDTLYLGGAENKTVRDNICTIVMEAAHKIEAEIEKLD